MTTTARADRLRNDGTILRAAAQALAADPGASMQAIADAAGVARLSVYRRYPSRDVLLEALRTAADADLERVLDAVLPWTEGVAAFESLVSGLAGVAQRYPIALMRYAPSRHDVPPVADAQIVRLLRAGQAAGVLRDDIDAGTLNSMLFGILAALRVPGPDSGTPEPVPGTGIAGTAVTVLLHGMGTSARVR